MNDRILEAASSNEQETTLKRHTGSMKFLMRSNQITESVHDQLGRSESHKREVSYWLKRLEVLVLETLCAHALYTRVQQVKASLVRKFRHPKFTPNLNFSSSSPAHDAALTFRKRILLYMHSFSHCFPWWQQGSSNNNWQKNTQTMMTSVPLNLCETANQLLNSRYFNSTWSTLIHP